MRISLTVLFAAITVWCSAQGSRKITRAEYIETYKDLAMQEMEKSGIPASITLAQGILESGDGNSRLARKANNHFGIKCHGWEGKSIRHDDDAKNECFRKYKSVEQSYHDHSEFLTTRGRYSFLFDLDQDDYKGWAKGLKKAGYATSPTYSKALIKIIEANELHRYDQEVIARSHSPKKKKSGFQTTEYAGNRKVHFNNRVKYVVAREGDTFNSLSEEMDLFAWQLPKYNESSALEVMSDGDYIYLQPKRNKAEAGKKTHMVVEGQTMHLISQMYGVKEVKLRARNHMGKKDEPKVGELVLLRGKRKGSKKKPLELVQNIELEDKEESDEFKVKFDLDE